MDPTIRLRIATRIHFALLRHYGEDVAVSTLLDAGDGAREALWVCDASGDAELAGLADRLRAAPRPLPPRAHTEPDVPQDLAWSRDTSGFGISRWIEPAPESEPGPVRPTGWLSPGALVARRRPLTPGQAAGASRSSSPPSLTWSPTA